MRSLYTFIFLILAYLITNCNSNQRSKQYPKDCIISFNYYRSDAVGPESLVSILTIKNKDLLEILINNPKRLFFKYNGGIYSIDSLYFPRPLIEIYDFKDSSLIFEQDVFGLRGYPELFIDSVVQQTKKEIAIEVTDSLTNKKWTIAKCK